MLELCRAGWSAPSKEASLTWPLFARSCSAWQSSPSWQVPRSQRVEEAAGAGELGEEAVEQEAEGTAQDQRRVAAGTGTAMETAKGKALGAGKETATAGGKAPAGAAGFP